MGGDYKQHMPKTPQTIFACKASRALMYRVPESQLGEAVSCSHGTLLQMMTGCRLSW